MVAICCHNQIYGQTYRVKKAAAGSIVIDGKNEDKAWSNATVLTYFTYPWENSVAPATSFSALWDGQWLYLLYSVKDDSVNIFTINNQKKEVGASDRVEIFFKIDDSMSPYYCLELDASGRVLDYKANYYRQMQYEWQWPADQLLVKTARSKGGYTVEAAISIASLQQLGLLNNNRLQAGLFRAECTGVQSGRADLKWISWVDPKLAQPDFHTPAAFGILVLE